MFPQAYALFGNGTNFSRPPWGVDYQALARYAMAGSLVAIFITSVLIARGG